VQVLVWYELLGYISTLNFKLALQKLIVNQKKEKKKEKKGKLTIRERKIACFNAVFFLTNTEFVFM
jgi:hypothetical protein